MVQTATCIVCGQKAPEPSKEKTLISGYGWRVRLTPKGTHEWRCPTCWKRYRSERTATPTEAIRPEPNEPPKGRK
jgi:hypothetical protein